MLTWNLALIHCSSWSPDQYSLRSLLLSSCTVTRNVPTRNTRGLDILVILLCLSSLAAAFRFLPTSSGLASPTRGEREEGGRSSPQPFRLRWPRRPNHRREREEGYRSSTSPSAPFPPLMARHLDHRREEGGQLLTAAFRRTYLEAASSPPHLEGSARPPARPCRRSVPRAPTAACRQREMREKEKDREKWEKERRRKKERGLTCEPHMSVGPTLFLSE